MSRCYLVCGPTSCGNRLVTRILVAAGCAGQGDHFQPWDVVDQWDRVALPPPSGQDVAFFRSLPHGVQGSWPKMDRLFADVADQGYEPFVVVTVRDPTCSQRSHVLHHSCAGDYSRAYRSIFAAVGELPWTFAVYESLILGRLAAVNDLLRRCGLPTLAQMPEPLLNKNAQYW